MTRNWLVTAGWSLLCALAAAASALGLAAAGLVVGLAPLALIGWLIGPSRSLDLGFAVPYLLAWGGAMTLSTAVAVFAWRQAAASARAMPRRASGAAALPVWSAAVTGSLAACVVAVALAAGLAERFGVQIGAQAPAQATRPASPAEIAVFRDVWKPRAEAGQAYAQFVTGAALWHGAMGQPVDRSGGRKWLEKAAAQGDPDAELSLLVADSGGHDGELIHFDAIKRLPALAGRAEGWRRVALELVTAQNIRLSYPGTVPSPAPEREKWVRVWLEKSARDGSRFAAIELARSFEDQRDIGGALTPDLPSAARWYAAAGASAEVQRLRDATSADVAAAERVDAAGASGAGLVPARPSASAELLERLERRASLVSASTAPTVLESQDALAHRIVHAEAARRYALIGDAAASMPDRLTIDRERSRALLFYRVAFDEGGAVAADKLLQPKDTAVQR